MTFISLNAQLVPPEKAQVSVLDRGFRYGDGLFETIALHGGVPYQFGFHMKRLQAGLDALKIDFSTRALRGDCHALIKANRAQDGTLRIQVTRGIGSRGYLPDPSHKQAGPLCIIETIARQSLPQEPVRIFHSSYRKLSPSSLPVQYKLCQGLNSTLARMEAIDQQCFDGVMTNDAGELCETSSANLFWIKGDTLYTPALGCGVLDGSTRHAILRLWPGDTREVAAPIDTLADADEIFITNALWQVLPVAELLPQGYRWDAHPAAERLRALLAADIAQYRSDKLALWS